MDTLNHSTTSFGAVAIPLTLCAVSQPVTIACSLVSAVIGAVPDLIGEWKALDIDIDKKWFKWRKVGDNYAWYDKCHRGEIVYLKYIPFIWLHIKMDSYCHGEGNRWYAGKLIDYFIPTRYKEKMWMESLWWGINVVLLSCWGMIYSLMS